MNKKKIIRILACLLCLAVSLIPVPLQAAEPTYWDRDFCIDQDLSDYNGLIIGYYAPLQLKKQLQQALPQATVYSYLSFLGMNFDLNAYDLDVGMFEESFAVDMCGGSNTLGILKQPFSTVDYAFVFPKTTSSQKLLKEFNEFVTLKRDQGILDSWEKYWFNMDGSDKYKGRYELTGDNGTIRVAMDETAFPYCYHDTNGILQGYDIEIIYAFCKKYGYDVIFDDVGEETAIQAVSMNQYDMAISVIVNADRAEVVRFSAPTHTANIVAVINTKGDINKPFWEKVKDSFIKVFIENDRWKDFISGIGNTLLITALSAVFGTIFGFFLYWVYKRNIGFINKFLDVINMLLSIMPFIVILLILYYIVFHNHMNGMQVSIFAFSVSFGFAFCGILNSCIDGLAKDQTEAAYALGYTKLQTFIHISLPGTMSNILPGVEGALIALIQGTAIVGYIAVADLTNISDTIRSMTYESFFPLISTAVIYYLLGISLAFIVRKVIALIDPRRRTNETILKGIKAND